MRVLGSRGKPCRAPPIPAGAGCLCIGGPMRLRGGKKSKKPPARSWKQHSVHHASIRKSSLRRNRNSGRPADYTVRETDPLAMLKSV